MKARAHTMVTPGTARIGNRWFERGWSAFIGNTIELTQQAGPIQWAVGDGTEVRVECEDQNYGVMEMGAIEWSEEYSPHAAGLILRKESPEGLGVTVVTHAFHDHPGQLRRVRVFNSGTRIFSIIRICAESLPLRRDELVFHLAGVAERRQAAQWTGDGHVAAAAPACGLLFGIDAPARYELFEPNSRACSIVLPGGRVLPPGGFWDLPPTFLIPFTGEPGEATQRLIEGFRERVESMLDWESRRLKRVSQDEPSTN